MLTIAQELRLEQKADLGGSAAKTLCEIDSPSPVAIPAISAPVPQCQLLSSNGKLLPMECGILALHQSLVQKKRICPVHRPVHRRVDHSFCGIKLCEILRAFPVQCCEKVQLNCSKPFPESSPRGCNAG